MLIGGIKDCATWKVEEAVHNFEHAEHGRHGFFYGQGKIALAAGGLPPMGRGATPLQNSSRFLSTYMPGNPRRDWGTMLVLHIQSTGQ